MTAREKALLADIKRYAQNIVAHRDEPCEYWTGQGCQVSMAHYGDDILKALAELESKG